jgi:hypothetical protein
MVRKSWRIASEAFGRVQQGAEGCGTTWSPPGRLLHRVHRVLISNEAMYGPFGVVMEVVTAEIGLGVALHLGAVIGAAAGA